MALTPDQKKRLAALDSGPEGFGEDIDAIDGSASSRKKSLGSRFQASGAQPIIIKILIVAALLGVATYFVLTSQLHKIDFKAVFSSGSGSPVSRLSDAVKLQREKARLLDKGNGHLLVGEYDKAFQTAKQIINLDRKDPRPRALIGRTVDALAQKAIREFDSGEIVASLRDVRTALKYRSNHAAATALYGEIADRLMLEAEAHHEKQEYAELITKAQEVQRIDQSNMAASILLGKTKDELLAEASLLFVSNRYAKSLEKVQLSLLIDPAPTTNARAHRLLKKITAQVASPVLELNSISTIRGIAFARFRIPGASKRITAKQGDTVSNYRVIKIDPRQKSVLLEGVQTGRRTTLFMNGTE